ncbi:MAG: hypothetical protein N3A72_01550 [bacterium]|nr:hypothetical protein [bacterium]
MKTKLNIMLMVIVSGIILTVGFTGCGTTMYVKPKKSSAEQLPFDIRVIQANEKQAQDYYRSKKTSYTGEANTHGLPASMVVLTTDQKKLVQLLGFPEYQRQFPNRYGKSVTEWIYLKQDYLVQFINGNIVYLGPVDDKEKTLIALGSPDEIETLDFAGIRKEIFRYKSRFDLRVFHNDMLVNER